MSNERANPFDVGGFEPKRDAAKAVRPEELNQLAEVTGFVSRSPKPARLEPAPTLAATTEPARIQRRRRTGRNHQVNIRATAETLDLLAALSDELDEPFGEVLDLALQALRRERNSPK